MKKVEFYQTIDGKTPLIDWLKTLDTVNRARVLKRINRIEDGNFGDWKHLQNSSLSEMRLFFGKGYRIYFKELDNIVVLLIAGGDKSDQKRLIEQANKYFEDFLNRSIKDDNKI